MMDSKFSQVIVEGFMPSVVCLTFLSITAGPAVIVCVQFPPFLAVYNADRRKNSV
jgi:hypothetical protein